MYPWAVTVYYEGSTAVYGVFKTWEDAEEWIKNNKDTSKVECTIVSFHDVSSKVWK